MSLAYRIPSRRYFSRVISVQAIGNSIESLQIDGIPTNWDHSTYFSVSLLINRAVGRGHEEIDCDEGMKETAWARFAPPLN
jgi:hypothetical protein